MLIAHVVPGYFAAVASQRSWDTGWSRGRWLVLWAVALGSTVAPDLDVVYNGLFRGFVNHSTLWTHSAFVYAGVALAWWLAWRSRHSLRLGYPGMLLLLLAAGGFSHLTLDAIAHRTPLLYPLSQAMIGFAPKRVVEGGLLAYVTDPIFLLEPLLIAVALVHWLQRKRHSLRRPSSWRGGSPEVE